MGFFQNVFGRKPELPALTPVTLKEQQKNAIAANIAAAPAAGELARLSQEQIKAMMNFAFPTFSAIAGQVGKNLLAETQGKIPSDVAAMTRLGSAGRALSGGYASAVPGSMGSNLEARDLGLTSLAMMDRGLYSAEGWLKSMEQLYAPSQAIFSGMFITPQQEYAATSQERDLQFQRSWLANQIAAMPDPVLRGLHDTVMELLGDVASIYGGKGGGGGGQRFTDTPNSQRYSTWGGWGGGNTGAMGGGYSDPMAGTV